MYCINCGVKLADSQKKCPLCGTVVFHPDLPQPNGEPPYPADRYPGTKVNRYGVLAIITAIFLLPLFITLLVDLQISGTVSWSGYVIGAILLSYVILVLPFWFRKYHPVVLIPCNFAAMGLYLLYIDLANRGGWFLSFAFPVVGGLGLIVTAVVVLTRYLRRGLLYILGGAAIALGVFMPLVEFLISITFDLPKIYAWSFYPLISLALLGGVLIFLGANASARETMERKLFI